MKAISFPLVPHNCARRGAGGCGSGWAGLCLLHHNLLSAYLRRDGQEINGLGELDVLGDAVGGEPGVVLEGLNKEAQ